MLVLRLVSTRSTGKEQRCYIETKNAYELNGIVARKMQFSSNLNERILRFRLTEEARTTYGI